MLCEKGLACEGTGQCIGAITNFKLLNVCLFDANINSNIFYAWLTQEFLPNIPNNAVIVLDDATFHKRNDMKIAIEQHGHTLEFLPPYGPDLNPIEKKWAQAKSIRRKFNYTPDELYFLFKIMTFYFDLAIIGNLS